jgi:hypothetical protein
MSAASVRRVGETARPGAAIGGPQRALPLSWVGSPVDALLSAVAAETAGALAGAVPVVRRAGSGRSQRVWAGA